jgi:voltage-gated potassium channel Kch
MADQSRDYKPWAAETITTFHMIIASAAFLSGFVALLRASAIAALVSIAITNLLVFGLLRCCAIASTPNLARQPRGRAVKSHQRWDVFPYLPTRMAAIILLPILLSALIIAFGGLYLSTGGGVVNSQTPAQPLVNWLDAIYFSFVTITTLGYGDFHPASAVSKWAVMGEVTSGLTMLAGAVPLLISRLTMWRD